MDVTHFTDGFIHDSAHNMALPPNSIFETLVRELHSRFPGASFSIPSKKQIRDRVHAIRGNIAGDFSKIENPPLSLTLTGTPFLRRNWFGDVNGVSHRILIWASDFGLALLLHQGQVFIDGTFQIVPGQFSQCVIVLAFDPAPISICRVFSP